MRTQKVYFTNDNGYSLSAKLELPANQKPHTYALFAHCFTCNKNLNAVRNISRSLNMAGIAVLRFDFTGLGESEGEFSDTNFTSNIQDLEAAARFLEDEYMAPRILIGHSLGGAAVICAGARIESVQAIATIGAPYDPGHVKHLLEQSLEEIEENGEAIVNIGGRPFKVKKQFLDDISAQIISEHLRDLRKALLIMHSPQDETVEIENAAKIYKAAFHPKSFITLDGADHLLNNKSDSRYAGEMIASWVKKYIDIPSMESLEVEKQVAVRLGNEGYTTEIMVRQHAITADEPPSVGGNDYGPSPYELVTAGLGACTAMTLQMYARRKKWDLKEVRVHLEHYKDYLKDQENLEANNSKIDHFDVTLEFEGELDETQKAKLMEIAKKCPVHRTLHSPVEIKTHLADSENSKLA